jgi:hypothetical protein
VNESSKTVLLLCVMNVLRTLRFFYAGVPACQLHHLYHQSQEILKCIFIPRILRQILTFLCVKAVYMINYVCKFFYLLTALKLADCT